MSFYKDGQGNKLVIPFSYNVATVYVSSLSVTLQSVFSFCNIPVPDHVLSKATRLQNTTHNRIKCRPSYDSDFNRSLTSLGVDEEKVKEHLVEMYACAKLK